MFDDFDALYPRAKNFQAEWTDVARKIVAKGKSNTTDFAKQIPKATSLQNNLDGKSKNPLNIFCLSVAKNN